MNDHSRALVRSTHASFGVISATLESSQVRIGRYAIHDASHGAHECASTHALCVEFFAHSFKVTLPPDQQRWVKV